MGAGDATTTTLDRVRPGSAAKVLDIRGGGAFRRRLLDLGFVPGAPVRVIKAAPLNDPVEYSIAGCHVSLRRQEAARVVVERERSGAPAEHPANGPHRHRRRFGRFHL
jgi:ferrous iron transport protein A